MDCSLFSAWRYQFEMGFNHDFQCPL
jgi:hypothetical protein